MTTHENGPQMDGWQLPTRRCCGEWGWELNCGTCGNIAPEKPLEMPDNVELGEN